MAERSAAAADGSDFSEAWTSADVLQDASVRDVACARLDAGPAAVAVAGGTVAVWDLESGRRLSPSPDPDRRADPGDAAPARTPVGEDTSADLVRVAVTDSAGIPVAVTGDAAGRIQVWDLRRGGVPLGEPLTELGDRVQAVAAAARGAGRGLALVARGAGATSTVYSVPVADQGLEVWDLAARERVRRLHHGGYTVSAALGESAGRALAVASASFSDSPLIDPADAQSRIFLWDLGSGEPVGGPLEPAHKGEPIGSVAVGAVDGRTVVVGESGGGVSVWDPGEARPTARVLDRGGAEFVLWGGTGERPLVFAGGGGAPGPDRRSWLRVWDPRDWRLLGESEPGYGVLARFAAAPDGGRVILPWAKAVRVLRFGGVC
jgi:WD40 repeat protein